MTYHEQTVRPRVPRRAADAASVLPPGPGNRPLPRGVVGLAPGNRGGAPASPAPAPSGTLLVGQGIEVRGAIEACQTLVVEGRVEASIRGEVLEILPGGRFEGTADVDRATIAGAFEGTLVVRGQLAIAAAGAVKGKIRFGKISIEPGGRISGDVDDVEGSAASDGADGSLTATGG